MEESNPLRGILLKVSSVSLFVAMSTSIKLAEGASIAQIVFFRSAFAMVPIFVFLAWTHELRTAFQTSQPMLHLRRGLLGAAAMACGFYGLTHLPLPEAIAIGYAMPLMTVVFSILFLGETVRIYRWSAVLVGMVGVMIISWPKLSLLTEPGALSGGVALGALGSLTAATISAYVVTFLRRMVQTERAPTIVLYFSLSCTLMGLMMAPFGWPSLDAGQYAWLIASGIAGGIGQIMLTSAYRYAGTSTIAPFEYVSIIFGILIGIFVFSDLPSLQTIAGSVIVVGAGIFIIFREHQLGLERKGARKAMTPQG